MLPGCGDRPRAASASDFLLSAMASKGLIWRAGLGDAPLEVVSALEVVLHVVLLVLGLVVLGGLFVFQAPILRPPRALLLCVGGSTGVAVGSALIFCTTGTVLLVLAVAVVFTLLVLVLVGTGGAGWLGCGGVSHAPILLPTGGEARAAVSNCSGALLVVVAVVVAVVVLLFH